MGLTKYRLGELLERNTETNENGVYGISDVRGVLNSKKISMTKADVSDRDLSKFLVVRPGGFVFNHRVHDKLGLGYNTSKSTFIFTNDYVAFYLKPEVIDKILLADYLYMWYLREEFDRYMLFQTYGSATLFFNWDNMCELEIVLPDITIQKKYVDVFNSLCRNQSNFENGLNDLNIVSNALYDKNKHENLTCISDLIEVDNKKNQDLRLGLDSLKGISESCRFVETTASVDKTSIDKYLIIENGEFAVNFMCLGNWGKFYIAYNDSGKDYIVSPACSSIRIKKDVDLNPYYFLCVLRRSEFQRKCVVLGDGNTRGGINTNDFGSISIPLVEREIQDAIANVYLSCESRKDINDRLKKLIKNVCPILIKGSIEEAM